MPIFDKMNRMIQTICNIQRSNDNTIAFCIVYRSRRDPTCYWTFVFSPYSVKSHSIPASFWCDSRSHVGTVSQSFIFSAFQSGRWEVRMISRLYLTMTSIPYMHLLNLHPDELIERTGTSEDRFDIVAHLLYHPRSPHYHL